MKLFMLILDTSFLFALFVAQDDFHEQALLLAKESEGQLLSCSFLVFQEFMTLLMSKVGSTFAVKINNDLLGPDSPLQLLKMDEEFFEESNALFRTLSPHKLSFVDVSLIVLSRNLEAKVLTFDKGLEQALSQ